MSFYFSVAGDGTTDGQFRANEEALRVAREQIAANDQTAANWRAEINKLNAQVKQIQARIRSLEAACRGTESVAVSSRSKRSAGGGAPRDQRQNTRGP